jgi:hypothetical protein
MERSSDLVVYALFQMFYAKQREWSATHRNRRYSRLAELAFVFARNFTAEAHALPFVVSALLSGPFHPENCKLVCRL